MHSDKVTLRLQTAGLFFLFLFITYLMPYVTGHESDKTFWIIWSTHIYNNGLSNAYGSGTDYLPLYQYFLYFFGKFFKSADAIVANINYIRCFTLIFEFLGLWYVSKWIDKQFSYFLIAVFSILNIAFSYNTVFWGQVDAIMSSMVFISLYYGWKNKMIASSIWLVLALNFKLQAIIFLPVWGLLFLINFFQNRNLRSLILPLITIAVVQVIILIPFMQQPNGLQKIWDVITSSVGRYPRISMNAFNFWHLVIDNPWDRTDDETVGGISFKTIGLALFFLTSLIVLIPLIQKIAINYKHKVLIDRRLVWLTCSLIAIFFFFFNTQMHERYSHPAFIFITAYAFYSKDVWPYLFFSLAYFLNMEKVLQVLDLNNYGTLIFEPEFITSLYLVTMALLCIRLFKPVRNDTQ